MRRLAFAVLLVALAGHAAARQPESKPKTDLELLQGAWEIVGLESGGKAEPRRTYLGNTLTFFKDKDGADRVTLREGGNPSVEFGVSLDPARTPKAIDLAAKANKVLGIYTLDGDDLTLCVNVGGTQRPTEFATRAGGDLERFTLKRSKWERYTDKAFGFTADFPGKPTESRRKESLAVGGRTTTTLYTAHGDLERLTYTLSVTPLPAKLDGRETDMVLDAAQKALLAEASKTAKARAEEGKFKPLAGVSAAREWTITPEAANAKDRDTIRARFYVAGDRLYGLTVTGPEEFARSHYAGRFWSSFRLPPAEKKEPPGKE